MVAQPLPCPPGARARCARPRAACHVFWPPLVAAVRPSLVCSPALPGWQPTLLSLLLHYAAFGRPTPAHTHLQGLTTGRSIGSRYSSAAAAPRCRQGCSHRASSTYLCAARLAALSCGPVPSALPAAAGPAVAGCAFPAGSTSVMVFAPRPHPPFIPSYR